MQKTWNLTFYADGKPVAERNGVSQSDAVVELYRLARGESAAPAPVDNVTPITALSGTPAQITAAARAYRVYYAKHPEKDGGYSMDHTSVIYVMDPRGRFVTNFTHENSPQEIAGKLRARFCTGVENPWNFVIVEPGNDRRNHHANWNSCAAKLSDRFKAARWRRGARLKHAL